MKFYTEFTIVYNIGLTTSSDQDSTTSLGKVTYFYSVSKHFEFIHLEFPNISFYCNFFYPRLKKHLLDCCLVICYFFFNLFSVNKINRLSFLHFLLCFTKHFFPTLSSLIILLKCEQQNYIQDTNSSLQMQYSISIGQVYPQHYSV